MIQRIGIYSGKKHFNLKVKKLSYFNRILGLMFKSKNSEILLFDFGKNVKIPIHSLFVFFPFLAVWLDDKNKIIEKRVVKPFCLSVLPKRSFFKLVEIPINDKNKELVHKLLKN
jgi:uncharacterized membrane protein (UPF0127 family)